MENGNQARGFRIALQECGVVRETRPHISKSNSQPDPSELYKKKIEISET
jgi:hypothetical protein